MDIKDIEEIINRRKELINWLERLRILLGFSNKSRKINPNAESYFEAIRKYKYAESASEETEALDNVLACFVRELNIGVLPFEENRGATALKRNIDMMFKSIGIDGSEEALSIFTNRSKNPNVLVILENAKSSKPQQESRENSVEAVSQKRERLMRMKIAEIPGDICSAQLKDLLGEYFDEVGELFQVSFNNLATTLSGGNEFPTRYLIELEYFFRINGVSYLAEINSMGRTFNILRNTIEEAVSVIMSQVEKGKKHTLESVKGNDE